MTEQSLKNILSNDRFVRTSGITLEKVEKHRAVAKLVLEDRHLNGADLVQGGAIYTLADFAFAAASNFSGRLTVTASAQISYLKPANGNYITATATIISESNSLCYAQVDVNNDQGELVARFNATGFRTQTVLD